MTKTILRFPEVFQQGGRFTPAPVASFFISVLAYIVHAIMLVVAVLVFGIIRITDYTALRQDTLGIFSADDIILYTLFMTGTLILVSVIYVRVIEKRPLSAIGLTPKRWPVRYASGFGIGAATIVAIFGTMLLVTQASFVGFSPIAFAYLLAFVVQGASEEIFFRGMMMTSLARTMSVFWAVVISSAFFALLHIGSGHNSVLYFVFIFMMGTVYALYTLRSGSIIGACAAHGAWNFTLGLVSVVQVGPIAADYALFELPAVVIDSQVTVNLLHVILIGVMFVASLLLLFAGKNRLVVRVPYGQWMIRKALRVARRMHKGRRHAEQMAMSKAVRDAVKMDKEKTVALLNGSNHPRYTSEWMSRHGFPDEICRAVEMLRWRHGESWHAYAYRVSDNALARSVKTAEVRYLLHNVYTGKSAKQEQVRSNLRIVLGILMDEA